MCEAVSVVGIYRGQKFMRGSGSGAYIYNITEIQTPNRGVAVDLHLFFVSSPLYAHRLVGVSVAMSPSLYLHLTRGEGGDAVGIRYHQEQQQSNRRAEQGLNQMVEQGLE
jgi:hypothetical protein